MKKVILLVVAFAMMLSVLTVFAGLASAETPEITVTGVGIFDSALKGIHTFNQDAKLFQVKFSGAFYDESTFEGGRKLWVQSELGDHIKINGKTVSEWNNIEFNSVQIHAVYSEQVGHYLEFNINGHEGLPTEDTDATVEILSTFPIFGGTTLGKDYKFKYTANSNAPFVLQTEEPIEIIVTGVGIFDSALKGIHTFNQDAKLFQVRFSGVFYDESTVEGGRKLWVQSELGDHIKINGKTVSEWNNIEFNSVQIHAVYSEQVGHYLEFNINGHEGLPTEDTDATVEILSTFPIFGGTTLGKDYKFKYTANSNAPFVLQTEEPIEEETTAAELPVSDVKIKGVGVFDSGVKGIHTFNPSAKLIQVTFTGTFYDPAQLTDNQKLWVQSELGDYITVNGKTISEWNAIEFNSAQIHVKNTSALGQYLEFNFSGLEGLPSESIDNEFIFSADFPMFDGMRLGEEVMYAYRANNNVPFVLNGEFPEETDPVVENPAKVKGVGVFDTNPAKGIHTFDQNAKLFQVTFTDTFYPPSKLIDNQRLFVQGEFGDFIKINGKTVSEWNAQEFNSVMIHVKNGSIGQYLEINVSGLSGLPREDTDNEIILLADFPLYGGTTLGEDVMYAYRANINIPFALNGNFEETTTAEETTAEEAEETTSSFIIVDDETTAPEADTATSATETTDASVTTAPDATSAVAESDAEETTAAGKKGGCGGFIASVSVIAVLGIAFISIKKEK